MKHFKKRWNITSNVQLIIIFIVFAITGTTAAKIAAPFTAFMGISRNDTPTIVYWSIRLLIIFPIYQLLLLFFGWIFGQFKFFWAFEKKFLQKMGRIFITDKTG